MGTSSQEPPTNVVMDSLPTKNSGMKFSCFTFKPKPGMGLMRVE